MARFANLIGKVVAERLSRGREALHRSPAGPARWEIPYGTTMIELDKQERRRRARNVAWIVGLGLLALNVLIGVPNCSGTGTDGDADAAKEPAGAEVAPSTDPTG